MNDSEWERLKHDMSRMELEHGGARELALQKFSGVSGNRNSANLAQLTVLYGPGIEVLPKDQNLELNKIAIPRSPKSHQS